VATLFAVLVIGVSKTLVSHGAPTPVVPLPHLPAAAGAASLWYHYFLHNHRAQGLKALPLFDGGQRVMVINVPWYLSDAEEKG
jgi:hypothetical protein